MKRRRMLELSESVPAETYYVTSKIGEGSYGIVYRVSKKPDTWNHFHATNADSDESTDRDQDPNDDWDTEKAEDSLTDTNASLRHGDIYNEEDWMSDSGDNLLRRDRQTRLKNKKKRRRLMRKEGLNFAFVWNERHGPQEPSTYPSKEVCERYFKRKREEQERRRRREEEEMKKWVEENTQVVAIKEFRTERNRDGIALAGIREVHLLSELDHPNVIYLREILMPKAYKGCWTVAGTNKNHLVGGTAAATNVATAGAGANANANANTNTTNAKNAHTQKNEKDAEKENGNEKEKEKEKWNQSDLYAVFDYAKYDLADVIKHYADSKINKEGMPMNMVKNVIFQTLMGMHYLHTNWIIHRDMKPSNILIMGMDQTDESNGGNRGVVKIADFGLAQMVDRGSGVIDDPGKYSVVATIWYRAPELLLGERKHARSLDMWSVGCILGELLCTHPLFRGKEVKATAQMANPLQNDQMEKIIAVLGEPSEIDWPELKLLPHYDQFKKKRPKSKQSAAAVAASASTAAPSRPFMGQFSLLHKAQPVSGSKAKRGAGSSASGSASGSVSKSKGKPSRGEAFAALQSPPQSIPIAIPTHTSTPPNGPLISDHARLLFRKLAIKTHSDYTTTYPNSSSSPHKPPFAINHTSSQDKHLDSQPFCVMLALDLLSRLLVYNPAHRYTAWQALLHPYFHEYHIGQSWQCGCERELKAMFPLAPSVRFDSHADGRVPVMGSSDLYEMLKTVGIRHQLDREFDVPWDLFEYRDTPRRDY